jgi:hypothetical protein
MGLDYGEARGVESPGLVSGAEKKGLPPKGKTDSVSKEAA